MQKRYGLSEEQTRQMVAARRFCLATLVNLMRERLIMQETLQVTSSPVTILVSHPGIQSQTHTHVVEWFCSRYGVFGTGKRIEAV